MWWPAASLALCFTAIYARLTSAAVLEAGGRDHVRTARAKALRPGRVIRRHVLRNALIPITTFAGSHPRASLAGRWWSRRSIPGRARADWPMRRFWRGKIWCFWASFLSRRRRPGPGLRPG
ncbi:ABC transporter permease subunit [Pseudogemmobacter sonorensis]|uniref:ABC transporter permease subunit n=1 Tax=Pseudogemmobacter sonorensis TaxID=2989681 RepID=UPI003F6618EE